jgi:endonuclease YncB( thermonuclease family)
MGQKPPSLSPACALCISWLMLAGPAAAAKVISVGDGDTLRVEDGGRKVTIRLACIDAPEMAPSPYGQQARQALQELLPVGFTVTLKARPETATAEPSRRCSRRAAPTRASPWCSRATPSPIASTSSSATSGPLSIGRSWPSGIA